MDAIKKFFEPRSIAVIGASANPSKIGYRVLANIKYGALGSGKTGAAIAPDTPTDKGFQGKIYPVNPKRDEILGLKTYKSILDIPDEVDQAVICVPPQQVVKVMHEIGQKGCKAATVITAGFAEIGEEGKKLEQEMLKVAKSYGVRVVGPNTFGVFNTHLKLNATFGEKIPEPGPISFVSQSGAVGASAISYGLFESIGFANFISIGNKADVDDAELIRYFATDKNTKCISLYIESLVHGREFFEAAKEVSWRVPIVAFKSGRTEAGARAAASHTASIASSDTAVEAAFKQAGIYRTKTLFGLLDASRALGYQLPPAGDRLAIVSNAGGIAVISADYAHDLGIPLAKLTDESIEKMNEFCPPTWSHQNPVDIVGDGDAERFGRAMEVVAKDPNVDAIAAMFVPAGPADPLEVAKWIHKVSETTAKPIVASMVGMVGHEASFYLEKRGIPEYSFPERAIGAMHALIHRGRFLRKIGMM